MLEVLVGDEPLTEQVAEDILSALNIFVGITVQLFDLVSSVHSVYHHAADTNSVQIKVVVQDVGPLLASTVADALKVQVQAFADAVEASNSGPTLKAG